MKTLGKVKVSDINEKDLIEFEDHVREKIKAKVIKLNGPLYVSPSTLVEVLRLRKDYLDYNLICMSCGHSEKLPTYALAQNAMSNKVTFTCDCGFKTVLPQH